VNEVETNAVRYELERVGHVGRLHHGEVNSYYLYGPINGAMVAHVQGGMGSTGQNGSTLTVADAIRELRPGSVIAVGVAFGIHEVAQPIGQLLLSARLTNYEKVKVTTDRNGGQIILERGGSAECSARLIGRFRAARLEDIGIDVKAGEILSGEKLVDDDSFKSALVARFPEAIGGEMEGTGLLAASNRESVEWLVAKAVCDYAANKSHNKQERQRIAAETSARAVAAVLGQGGLTRRRSS
jgi:nucleoside phosphorylase